MSIHKQQPAGGAIVEAAAGLAPNTVKTWFAASRPAPRPKKKPVPPVVMPHRPASPRSWRFPPPLT